MWRHVTSPRAGWQDTVVAQGLVFPMTPLADGSGEVVYWNESAWYEFTSTEIERLEAVTDELYAMCLHAGAVMAERFTDRELMLPSGTMDLVRESLRAEHPSAHARFDLSYDGELPAKMLEINGDTPTGLIETAVAQWNWLEDVFPDRDQWNSVHDRLVRWWREQDARGLFPDHAVHFFHSATDTSGEEEMTTTYMRDTAAMAGLRTYGHVIEQVGWDEAPEAQRFVDVEDLPIRAAYKLYPWESMLAEEFGPHLLERHEREPVRWVEPVWKLMLSTKAILPVLWELYPDHPNLLPAYLGHPGDLTEWVAKPLQGREGDNVWIHTHDSDDRRPGHYEGQTLVYQQWNPIPSFDGNRAVIGSWVVGGVSAGCIVRESDGPVTDYFSRVVPHVITDADRPDEAQVQRWLDE
ncbi:MULTISPECIES: glutathionylspermidine synthase family protein [unclassified Nocardioides]|uniref:glutathionylspermidine synthase family protein n=1 Tax=unclassified Nocardioides TaxID=2615069 RepID=UPI0006FE8486|nr:MULTISPECIES: glutathionylspermidine synthase family protein [unclassified Nocardioides]KRA29450.1 glutathionylspermidine synthase [Nocardioides sp. Root614]KRA88375.1 glutathionylspermidine synthase [Nocardioides sp. Root682]